jgi:acyl-CoA thioester hydrolase
LKPPLQEPHFLINIEVRDHELDHFGVANNAMYLNYFEHAQHAFLASLGISLKKFLEGNYRAMISLIELEYVFPLHSCDIFSVKV